MQWIGLSARNLEVLPNILYHGSPVAFKKFDMNYAAAFKDFGKGFYLTTNSEQAFIWANKKRRSNEKPGYLYEYKLLRQERIKEELNIIEFLEYDLKWAEYVGEHRSRNVLDLGIDLVYDRMADSSFQEITKAIDDYYQKLIDQDSLLRVLAKQKSGYDQYCFKTLKAQGYLICSRVGIISGSKDEPQIDWKEAEIFYEECIQ